MDVLWQDARYALRALRTAPLFTLTAVVTLALGIGANVAIFSAVDAVLLRPLPYPESERLTAIWAEWRDNSFPRVSHTGGNFRRYQRDAQLFEGIAAVGSVRQNVTGREAAVQVQVGWVSENFFSVLRVAPILGRDFTPDEGPRSLILGHAFWQRYFAGDPGVLDRAVNLDGQPFTIVGVLPAGFKLQMASDVGISTDIDVWKPPDPVGNPNRWVVEDVNSSTLRLIGRLKPGVTLAQAQEEMDAIARQLREQFHGHAAVGFHLNVHSLHREVVGHVRPILLTLLVAVGLVLLVACANVANLLLSRAQTRQQEIAVRTSLGARPWRIVRQLMTEGLALAMLGGAAGLALGYGGVRGLVALEATNIPRLESVALNGRIVAFTVLASLLAVVLFGLIPALRAIRLDLNDVLKQRQDAGGSGRSRLSRLLIVVEVALSLMLLVGAGLLLRSAAELQGVRPGFDVENLLTFSISLPGVRYQAPVDTANFLQRFEEQITTLPGVNAVGTVWPLPLEGQIWAGVYAPREKAEADDLPMADFRVITPGYPATVGARLLEGRFLRETDSHAVLVDEKMARLNWPPNSAVGQRMFAAPGDELEEFEIVGVLETIRHADLKADGRETIYFPAEAWSWSDWELCLAVRTAADPLGLVGPIRSELQTLDLDIPMAKIHAMEDYVDDALAPSHFGLALMSIFAAVALILAAVGLYGVIAYTLSQRTREIGIRMAFGARSLDILRLVMKEGLGLTLFGVIVGTFGSLSFAKLVSGLLFGVSTSDPLTYGATAGLLTVVTLLACYVPARRASRINPVVALRSE